MDPTPEPTPTTHARVSTKQLLGVVVVLALLVVALGAAVLLRDTKKTAAARSTEVFLEAKDDAGPEVFTTEVATRTPRALPSTTTTTIRANTPANAVASVSGSTVGLYGGTLRTATCNKAQLVNFLERNPDKAAAWATVQGIRSDQIRAYVAGLTPVVLLRDTRVTNHGFARGRATPRQSILQAGTAVLVDRFGVPRAKCACGNPLTPPHPVTAPVETGRPGPGFVPSAVVVVVPRSEITTFVLVDVDTGDRFDRPVGTSGGKDTTTSEPTAKPTGWNPRGVQPPVVASPAGTYTVQFSGEHLSGPCTPWGTGTGAMDVTISGATIAITLHQIGGTLRDFRGTYNPQTGAFSAPDVQYGLNPLSGTFVQANGTNGVFTVSDGRETSQNANGGPCIGAFTATQQIG